MFLSCDLNESTLSAHAARVSVPTYDRALLTRGVVHISVGSFHRAHQAVYFDELARRGSGDGWAVTGVGLYRRTLKEALDAQDGLYTVVARDHDRSEARVVGVITRYLYAPDDRAAVLDTLADERTRLVTLTITGAGYDVDLETVGPGSDHAGSRPVRPSRALSAVGLLVEALDVRRRAGRPPFTVLSCDNMTDNGVVARTAVLRHAAGHSPGLAEWVADHGAFPSSMVDRITPGTTAVDREMVEATFGVRDRCPVMTEPYSQWVIEDDFCHGRPPLDEVGVHYVSDVRPYALTKTRLLNAGHSALGYLGSLAGYRRSDEAMRDPVFATYLERMMREEIAPLLPDVGIDVAAYGSTVRSRFANPAVADRLARLCRNGSSKVPAHLLSSIREARACQGPHALLSLAVAAWCRYLRGVGPDGRRIAIDDPCGERLRVLALAGGTDPAALLGDDATFGSLGRDPSFVETVGRDLRDIASMGVPAVIAARLAEARDPVRQ